MLYIGSLWGREEEGISLEEGRGRMEGLGLDLLSQFFPILFRPVCVPCLPQAFPTLPHTTIIIIRDGGIVCGRYLLHTVYYYSDGSILLPVTCPFWVVEVGPFLVRSFFYNCSIPDIQTFYYAMCFVMELQ